MHSLPLPQGIHWHKGGSHPNGRSCPVGGKIRLVGAAVVVAGAAVVCAFTVLLPQPSKAAMGPIRANGARDTLFRLCNQPMLFPLRDGRFLWSGGGVVAG